MDIASQAALLACLMRITKEQLLAGYPALKVRAFLRSYRIGISVAPAAEEAFSSGCRTGGGIVGRASFPGFNRRGRTKDGKCGVGL